MTTLQLATLIVERVRFHPHLTHGEAAVVVLQTLEAHSSWFCRSGEDGQGLSVDLPYAVPAQLGLFEKKGGR